MPGELKLIYVYNADRGVVAALADAAHRACSPETFPCRLSTLTRSPFGAPRRWQRFVASLGVPVTFVFRREFVERFGDPSAELPALFSETGGELTLQAAASAIQAAVGLDDLERLTVAALRTPPGADV